MDLQELDTLFRTRTRREQYYLEHQGAPSPSYRTMEHRQIDGKDVLYFRLPALKEAEILIRKDSRFTDVPYYIHSNLNMNYIYSGKCDYVINSRSVTLHQGDVVIFDKDVVRRKQYAGEEDIVINISMSNEFFNNSFLRRIGEQSIISNFMLHVLSDHSDTHNHYLVFRTNHETLISTLFCQLFTEYYGSRIYGKEMIQGYLHLIFVELLRLYQEDKDNQLVQISSGQMSCTLEILHYIEEHYKDCTLAQLSAAFGYHPKYISALLKKQTGKTFKETQLDQRLKAATALLIDTDDSIQSICHKVGASNQNFFYKSFEAAYRMSPGDYRKKNTEPVLPRQLLTPPAESHPPES